MANHVFYTTDYDGTGESVLSLFAVALARVPCVADPHVTWHDFASPVPFYTGFFRSLHGLVDPFVGAGLLHYRYSLETDELGFKIHSALLSNHSARHPAHAPQRLTATVVQRYGLGRIEARLRNDLMVTAELIDPPLPSLPHQNEASSRKSTPSNLVAVP